MRERSKTYVDNRHVLVKWYPHLRYARWNMIALHKPNGTYGPGVSWRLSTISGTRIIWRGWFIIFNPREHL